MVYQVDPPAGTNNSKPATPKPATNFCVITGEETVVGQYARFAGVDGASRSYALSAHIDKVARDIAKQKQSGVLVWNPKRVIRDSVAMELLTPCEVPIAGGTTADIKQQILTGGTTRIRRRLDVDGRELLVEISVMMWPLFKGAMPEE